tara:strand:- start:620 stop:745 length:126 start_codon:yes stop_codon:yes gene_type:complete
MIFFIIGIIIYIYSWWSFELPEKKDIAGYQQVYIKSKIIFF